MLVTDLAYRDLEERADGVANRIGRLFSRLLRRTMPGPSHQKPYALTAEHHAHLRLVDPIIEEELVRGEANTPATDFKWRRHPQLLRGTDEQVAPDAEDLGRGARSASIRGLFLARSGRLDEARDAFSVAARDAKIDLTAIPGFWELSRGGMHAAVGAYEDVERYRDAATLEARLRLKYRPRSIASLSDVSNRRTTASGS